MCAAECALNRSLPALRASYCLPLAALATPATGPAASTESSARGDDDVESSAALAPGSGDGGPHRSARTTAFVARSILVMLGAHPDKLVDMFDDILFPCSKDNSE